jgi:hypothetical protein
MKRTAAANAPRIIGVEVGDANPKELFRVQRDANVFGGGEDPPRGPGWGVCEGSGNGHLPKASRRWLVTPWQSPGGAVELPAARRFLGWRQHDGIDHVDYAVACLDVGLHDVGLVDHDA